MSDEPLFYSVLFIMLLATVAFIVSRVKKKRYGAFDSVYLLLVLSLSCHLWIQYIEEIDHMGAESLSKDLSSRLDISIPYENALEISKLKSKKEDTSYLDIVIEKSSQKGVVYKAMYRVLDGEVVFYKEQQEDIFIEIK